ncbi:MAG: metallophosphoesterase [Haloplanus sp.]
MLVVVSDTHGRADHRLTDRTLAAVREADVVVHAGDFTTPAVLDSFHEVAARLVAVHGNADDAAVSDRLPDATTLTYAGVRVAVTHTRRGGATALSLFGRERGADLVVFGHTHRPTVRSPDAGPTLLNPGSYADPRGNRAAHAELRPVDAEDGNGDAGAGERGDSETPATGGLRGVLRSPSGDELETFRVSAGVE